MDPTTTTAGLIAVAIGLVKIIEKLVEWTIKKMSPNNERMSVVLDTETLKLLHETYTKSAIATEIMVLKDTDGVPMVYTPRSIPDDLRQTALLLRDISYTQQKLLDRLEALDDRVEDVQSTQRTLGRR